MDEKRMEYMIAWREKKIQNLEERIKIYAEMVNMCLALCVAGSGERISKEKVRRALRYTYEVSEDKNYYIIKKRKEENEEGVEKAGSEGE